MSDQSLTLAGNLTADPELRFTPSGAAVCSFTVASTPRYYDKNTNQWVDGDALFMRCSVWRQQGENAAESFQRGNRVIVTGTLKQRSFETKEGEQRTVIEMDVTEMGASVKFATAVPRRAERASDEPAEEPAEEPAPAARNGRERSTQRRERASTTRR